MTLVIANSVESARESAGTTDVPILCWDNFLEGSGPTLTTGAGTEESDGAIANAVDGTTWSYWRATPDTAGVVLNFKAEFATARTATFCGVAAHNLADLGATAIFQRRLTSMDPWVEIGSCTPTTGDPFGIWGAGVNAEDYRLRITNITDADTVEIGVVWMGQPLTAPHKVWRGYQPILTPTQVQVGANVSEGGQFLGSRVVRTGSRTALKFNLVSQTYARGADWLGFQTHFNEGKPFFVAWRPETYGDLHYGWRDGAAAVPVNSGPGEFMSVSLAMRCHDG